MWQMKYTEQGYPERKDMQRKYGKIKWILNEQEMPNNCIDRIFDIFKYFGNQRGRERKKK